MKKAALMGSLGSAIFFSSCCIGPLALSLFGKPSPISAVILNYWRPVFGSLSILLWVAALFDCYGRGREKRWSKSETIALWLTVAIDVVFFLSAVGVSHFKNCPLCSLSG